MLKTEIKEVLAAKKFYTLNVNKPSMSSDTQLSIGDIFGEREGVIFHERVLRECRGELSGMGIRISMQDYKCLHVEVTIWATLVNTHADSSATLYFQTHSPGVSTMYVCRPFTGQVGIVGDYYLSRTLEKNFRCTCWMDLLICHVNARIWTLICPIIVDRVHTVLSAPASATVKMAARVIMWPEIVYVRPV